MRLEDQVLANGKPAGKKELEKFGYKHAKIGDNHYMVKEVNGNLYIYKKESGARYYEKHAEYLKKEDDQSRGNCDSR